MASGQTAILLHFPGGGSVLDEISSLVCWYVYLLAAMADAVALWCLTTWIHDRLELSTFLNVTNATKRCGKSLLVEMLAELAHRPLQASGRVTPAAMFRIIQEHAPTLLLDEADTFLADDPELRGDPSTCKMFESCMPGVTGFTRI